MKFKDMPYTRPDMESILNELKELKTFSKFTY